MSERDEPVQIIRVLHDPTDRRNPVEVVPDTHQLAAVLQDGVEVVPVLPGSAYDGGVA